MFKKKEDTAVYYGKHELVWLAEGKYLIKGIKGLMLGEVEEIFTELIKDDKLADEVFSTFLVREELPESVENILISHYLDAKKKKLEFEQKVNEKKKQILQKLKYGSNYRN